MKLSTSIAPHDHQPDDFSSPLRLTEGTTTVRSLGLTLSGPGRRLCATFSRSDPHQSAISRGPADDPTWADRSILLDADLPIRGPAPLEESSSRSTDAETARH